MDWEMAECVQFDLTPTLCTVESVQGMYDALQEYTSKTPVSNTGSMYVFMYYHFAFFTLVYFTMLPP